MTIGSKLHSGRAKLRGNKVVHVGRARGVHFGRLSNGRMVIVADRHLTGITVR